jgi:hypothetical protein
LIAGSRPSGTAPRAAALRLRAADPEDLAVISACLQDALVPVRDLAYDAAERRFVLVANRFRWEGCGDGAPAAERFARILCGLAFEEVERVAYRGFHRGEQDRILSLLAVQSTPGQAGVTIEFDFAGGAAIRLAAAAIGCRLRDLGEAWPTLWQPGHGLDELP